MRGSGHRPIFLLSPCLQTFVCNARTDMKDSIDCSWSIVAAVLAAHVAYSNSPAKADVTTNRVMGREAENFLFERLDKLHKGGIETQVRMRTDDGSLRIVDILDTNCQEIVEIKVGKVSLSKKTAEQLAKDMALREKYGYKPQIHFFKSPTTNQGGPSKPLQEFLSENNITSHVHNHTVQESSSACRSCQHGLREIARAGSSEKAASDSVKPLTETQLTKTPQTSATASQALCAAGAVNLAIALAALAMAMHSAHKVQQVIEKEELPELRKESRDLIDALKRFEATLRAEIDIHLNLQYSGPDSFEYHSRISEGLMWIREKLSETLSDAVAGVGSYLCAKMEQHCWAWLVAALFWAQGMLQAFSTNLALQWNDARHAVKEIRQEQQEKLIKTQLLKKKRSCRPR